MDKEEIKKLVTGEINYVTWDCGPDDVNKTLLEVGVDEFNSGEIITAIVSMLNHNILNNITVGDVINFIDSKINN